MRRALFALLAACGADPVFVQPVYDEPVPEDVEAVARGLDALTLSVAHAGSVQDLVSLSFSPGETVELANVPFDNDLVVHLSGRIGGGDVAYGRTCVFGLSAGGPVPEPHLFFSRSVKFATLPFATPVRTGGLAVTFTDGSALIAGGANAAGTANRTLERFDPRTGARTEIATLGARVGAVAAMLGGDLALIGGAADGGGADFVEIIDADDPASTRVSSVADTRLAMARIELTATTLTDGRIVAIGGRPPGSPAIAPSGAIAEIAVVSGAAEIRELRATLAHPRAGHTATRLGDDVGAPVLIVGGFGPGAKPVEVAELWKPLSGELANPVTFAPKMKVPRRFHQARLMPDGSLLIVGGLDGAGQPVRTLERFTIDEGFVIVGELPDDAGVLDFTATTLPDGRVLLAGGRLDAADTVGVDSAFIARLDVIDGALDVVATDKLATRRAGHQATLLCDGTVLVTGGTAAESPAERYNPPLLGRR
ncbi:MAG: hypothetical protein KIT31_35845 [Deltaproteobacteria bacterium]|nr:hypothetical protein [Deltaproteobacteria bacterium]